VYQGETYYARPAIKSPPYGKLIATYFFVGGLAGASQLIAGLVDLCSRVADRPIVRAGRYLAVAGALVSPVLLIADLRTPNRWYNMLRIFRRTSAMSIGSWTLMAFGTLSGITAAAQALADHTAAPQYRRLARWVGVPAAVVGSAVATYTGALLAATSNTLWAASGRRLPALFGASAVSTATAALSLATQQTATPASAARLERLALIAGSTELALATAIDRHWQRQGVATPLQQQPTAMAYRFGFHGLGVLVPVLIHSVSLLRRRRSRRLSVGAAMATLAGGFIFRSVLVSAGRAAAQRPADYFRFTQPRHDTQPEPALPALAALGQNAVEMLEQALHLTPPQLGKEIDEVEQVVSRLRDILIQYLRQDQTSTVAPRWQAALAGVNAALSLIVGVEYPAAGPQRSSIEQARDTLAQMLAEGLLAEPESP
jgi:formate-dependent nitrite reductase membrane component NrfD